MTICITQFFFSNQKPSYTYGHIIISFITFKISKLKRNNLFLRINYRKVRIMCDFHDTLLISDRVYKSDF